MEYGFRSAHVNGPRGAAPRLDFRDGDTASEYCVGVPPCPSPRIQTSTQSVQNSVPQIDDQVQASYCYIHIYPFEWSRTLTLT